MHPLVRLSLIWAAVFSAIIAAKKTRLTPVLFFLYMGFTLVNLGILPRESDLFIREFADPGIVFSIITLGFEVSTDHFVASIMLMFTAFFLNWWHPSYVKAETSRAAS